MVGTAFSRDNTAVFLVPTLCVGMQLCQQGLPRRAWEPDNKEARKYGLLYSGCIH